MWLPCLSVCLSVRSHISKTTRQNYTRFSSPVTCSGGSDHTAIRYVLPVVWMTLFSYNGGNGPESQTTRMFRPVRQVAAPEAKSAVYNCILLLVETSCGLFTWQRV